MGERPSRKRFSEKFIIQNLRRKGKGINKTELILSSKEKVVKWEGGVVVVLKS